MKRKLALLLAAVMVAAMVPVTAFAKSDNHVDKVVTVKTNDTIEAANAPKLVVTSKEESTKFSSDETFELVLDGAEWKIVAGVAAANLSSGVLKVGKTVSGTGYTGLLLDSTTLVVTITADNTDAVSIPMEAKVTGAEATVTLNSMESTATAGTYTFAKSTGANATAKINGTVDVEIDGEAKELKSIVITETVKGAIDTTKDIKLKLYGDFKFTAPGTLISTDDGIGGTTDIDANGDLIIDLTGAGSAKAAKLSLTGVKIQENGAKEGEVAEIVISGAGVEKTTLEVAKAITYGVSFTVEDKKLPVFYSGRKYTDADDDTLKVTFKETAEDSWWFNRKTTLTFPEGVKVVDANIEVKDSTVAGEYAIKDNVVTLTGFSTPAGSKAKWEATFVLSISPDFAGEITCTVGGPAVAEDITVTVAEAQYPVTFEVEVSDVSIDYRNVTVGDITVKETFAGALEEGTALVFDLDEIDFEKGTKVEVIEGDIELDDITVVNGRIIVPVKEESYKTPATFKLTGLNVYLDRSLPAGSYNLEVGNLEGLATVDSDTDAIFKNYASKADIKDAQTAWDNAADDAALAAAIIDDAWAAFPIDSYELAEAYIEVVTAGRDQDDSSFTTKVAVTIGANTMAVGQGVVALDAPAYIANGYTMLPVRAVADALSNNASTVLWNNETKTVTIAFGARIISMTIGSKVMNINGVEIGMNAAPEITANRTFLPLRDLGYALGLTDADIAWDETTATATLN